MKASKMLNATTRIALYSVILLVPVFFLPFTAEILEISKQYLLYAGVTIGALAWLLRGFLERKLTLTRTPMDLPILVLLLVVLVSSIFSKDANMSFFGTYDRLVFGFVPLLFYVAMFYLIVNHISEKHYIKNVLTAFGVGGALASLYFWIKYSGLLASPLLPVWNTVAGTNGRFAVALLVVILVASIFLLHKSFGRRDIIFWSVTGVLCLITVIAIGHKGVFVAGAVGLGIVLIMSVVSLEGIRIPAASAALVVFLVFLFFGIFGNMGFLTAASLPAEVTLAHNTSWQIARGTFNEGVARALVGSGPATYTHDFSAHRPTNFNGNLFWAVRFGIPSSESAGITATLGVLGAVVFLFFVVVALWFFKNARTRNILQQANVLLFRGVLAVWLLIFTFLFFIPFGTAMWVYFFVFLALTVVTGSRVRGAANGKTITLSYEGTPQSALTTSFTSIVMIAVFLVLAIYLGRFYAGEVWFNKGLQDGDRQQWDQGIIKVAHAAQLNSNQARYHLALTRMQFQRALKESQAVSPDGALAGQMIASAVANARRATEIAPNLTAAWEQLGGIYSQVIPIASEAQQWAIEAFGRAIALEPTNPVFYVLRAQLYFAATDVDRAEQDVKRAVELKPNYAQGYAVLAALKDSQGDFDAAVKAQERAIALAPRDETARYQLARIYVNRNTGDDLTNAEKILSEIIVRNPDYANALFTLGTLYEKRGQSIAALEQFRKVQQLNPENEEVRAKIDRLTGQLAPVVPVSPAAPAN